MNDSLDLMLPGEYNHPLFQPNHTFLHAARFHCCTDFPALKLRASELFPGGTAVPAAKPRLPPAAPQATHARLWPGQFSSSPTDPRVPYTFLHGGRMPTTSLLTRYSTAYPCAQFSEANQKATSTTKSFVSSLHSLSITFFSFLSRQLILFS